MKQELHTLSTGARVECWLHDAPSYFVPIDTRPSIIICPGGAYWRHAQHECDPVMSAFYNAGYQCFLLRYSLFDEANARPVGTAPLTEAAEAVAFLRDMAKAWHLDGFISVLGFSAGGHLAASLGTHWHDFGEDARPDATVLCYPVISDGPTGKVDCFDFLCQTPEQRRYFSLEQHVSADTAPVFLWHTMEDASVPVVHALRYFSVLHEKQVPCEAHFFQRGAHGLGLATQEVCREDAHVAHWFPLCLSWLSALRKELESHV